MTEELIKRLECLGKIDGCLGLAISSLGGGVGLEKTNSGYVIRTKNSKEFFGNCKNYQQCYDLMIKQTGPQRKPAITK